MKSIADTYGIKILSDPFVSGDQVYFTMNWIEDDDYRSSIYSFNGKEVTRVTFGGHERKPLIHDGKLYYISYGKDEENLTVIEGVKEPKTLFSNKSIGRIAFHGGKVLAVTQDKSDDEEPLVTGKLKYRFDTSGFLRTRMKLVILDPAAKELVSGDFDVGDVFSNGDRILFTATKEDDDKGSQDVYELNIKSRKFSRITEGEGEAEKVIQAENGEIAYIGHREGLKPWVSSKLVFHGRKEVKVGNNAGNTVGTDLFVAGENSLIEDGSSLYLVGQEGGLASVYSVRDDKVKRITGDGKSVRSFHIANGELAVIYTSYRKPSILSFKGEEYDPNPEVVGKEPEHMTVDGKEAWLMLASRDNPTVLAVHGGPQTAYGHAFSLEFNFLHDNGFNVLFGNPRGSDGYGDDFARGCIGDWGGGDFEDIMSFVDHSVSEFGLKDNFAITGGSYGGYMTNAAIVKTDRFKCAISERCVSNLMSMCGTSDIGFWFNSIESDVDDPWSEEGVKKLLSMSPITGSKKVKTPTLFIHGEEDYRCPIEQSEQMYTALKMNGVKTVLARYPGDSHEHARRGKPANMKDRLQRKLDWFQHYMSD